MAKGLLAVQVVKLSCFKIRALPNTCYSLVMKEVVLSKMSVRTYRTARHHMSKTAFFIKKKKCGLIGTEIIQRFPTVAIENAARHNESNPWSYWIPFFFLKKNVTSFLPFSPPSLTMLYILYNKVVKTFDRNPGFCVLAVILFVTLFLTRALQTVYDSSVTRLKLRLNSILKIQL
jgi:hypothetical protein